MEHPDFSDKQSEEVPLEANGFPKAVFIAPLVLLVGMMVASNWGEWHMDVPGGLISLMVLAAIIWLFGVYDLLTEERMGTSEKILWMIVFLGLNVVGTFLYMGLKGRYVR